MARLTAASLDRVEDPAELFERMHPNTGQDVVDVISAFVTGDPLGEPEFEPWSDAFDVLRSSLSD